MHFMNFTTHIIKLPTVEIVYEICQAADLARIHYLPVSDNPRNKIYGQCCVRDVATARAHFKAKKSLSKARVFATA